MNAELSEFRRGVVAPVECIKEGWALIKDQYWLFLGISLVGVLIGGAVPIVLLGPMMIGIFLCLLQRQRGEPVEFGTLFKGFEQFVQGLVVAARKMVPGIIGLILLNGLLSIVGVLCCIIGVYFYLPIAFASQVVAYRRVFPDIGSKLPSPPPPPGNWA